MKDTQRTRQIAHLYLCIVPLVAFILAFAVGHVTPGVYIPLWIAHSFLMWFCIWHLGVKYANSIDGRSVSVALMSSLFILPWILVTIFAGMGPPPFNISGWADLADEQRVRFGILVVCGVSLAVAVSLFHELAKNGDEKFYARMALTIFLAAVPLFLVVMAFWGTVFTDTAIEISKTSPRKTPEWLAPWRHMIEFLSTIEISLFYLCTALLAMSMKQSGWLSVNTCRAYFAASVFSVVVTLLPASVPEPLLILNYVAGIPAITMLMPYLIGLALLRRIEILK